MRIAFDITREDLLSYHRRALRDDARWARGWRKFARQRAVWIVAALGASALWVVLIRDTYGIGGASPTNPVFWLGMLALYLWWVAAPSMKWDKERYIEQHVRSFVAAPEARYSEGQHELDLRPEGLTFQAPHHQLELSWTGVFRIMDEPGHIFIQRRDGSGLVIPKRCLRDADQARELVSEARRHHAAAGADIGSRLGVFLADRDISCDACGYNLRGTSSGHCPECAADLGPLLVRLSGTF